MEVFCCKRNVFVDVRILKFIQNNYFKINDIYVYVCIHACIKIGRFKIANFCIPCICLKVFSDI